jgi:hypothetical protein
MGAELAKISHLSYEEKQLDFVSKVRSIASLTFGLAYASFVIQALVFPIRSNIDGEGSGYYSGFPRLKGVVIEGVLKIIINVHPCLCIQNMERFKKPNAFGRFPNKGKAKAKEEEEEEEEKSHVEDENEEEEKSHVEGENEEEDTESDSEDEEDEMDEDELMVNNTKRATDGQLQVPHEGERECKKPRYAQGSS